MSLKTSNETALWSGMMVMFDDGMTSDGNGGGGVMLLWRIFAMVCFCVLFRCGILYGSWYRVAVGFCFPFFPFSRVQDRRERAVVNLLVAF